MKTTKPTKWQKLLPENEALVAEFIAQAEVAEGTRYKYRSHLNEFEAWYRAAGSGSGLLTNARPGDVSRFMAYLRSGNRFARPANPRAAKVPSNSTRRNILSSLASFYQYLVTVEIVPGDPTRAVKLPHTPHKPGLILTAEEVRKLLDVPTLKPRCRIQTYLLVFTGARGAELRSLRWCDVDFTNRTMQLLGKGGKYRVIDIHPRLVSELRKWYLHQEDHADRNERIREAKANPETDYVLLTHTGKKLAHSTLGRQLKMRAAQAGLYLHKTSDGENVSAVHPHMLRRTFGTILLNDGHHIDAVADVLGHSSIDTTRKHYAFSSTERRKMTVHGYKV